MAPQLSYIARRLLYALATVWVLVTATFFLMQLLPGGPFMGHKALNAQVEAALYAKFGLDLPPWQQYVIFWKNLLRGDLGFSVISGRQVTDIIAQAFPVSLELGLRALVFALVGGLLLGSAAALKRGTGWDTASMVVTLLGVSVPSFVLGALLQYTLGMGLYRLTGVRVFAIMGWGAANTKLLPAFALGFGALAVVGRMMRASLLEVLAQDYIRTATVKGLGRGQILLHHCLRNALGPVVTVLGPMAAVLLTGTFAVEHVFSIPGMGKYFVDSVQTNDYPVIVGTTLFFGVFLVFCGLLTDIINSLLDPRVKLGGARHDGS